MPSIPNSSLVPTGDVTPSLTVALVTGQELPPDFIERTAQLDFGGPFGRSEWWDSWWRHLRPANSELFLLTVSQGEKLLGFAPWYRQRVRGFGRVVRFMGDGRVCSDYMTISADAARQAEVWQAIRQWVAAEAGQSWDTFILSGIAATDEPVQVFCEQLSQQNIVVDRRTVANTWRVSLPETWEAYVDLFSKQHRNRLRRTKREMLDSGRAVLQSVTSRADFERGFEIQRQLHQSRRNSLGDGGCFADPRFEAFLCEANQRFLAQGNLRLQWTEVDGEPVAFDSGYVDQGGVYVYQTAFDPAKSEISPGRLHLHASILKAIQEGHRFFDFLRGDEPYKAHFHAQPIPLIELRLIAPRMVPRLGHRFWKLRKQVQAQCTRRRGEPVLPQSPA